MYRAGAFYTTIAYFHMIVVEHTFSHEIKNVCFLYNMTKIEISRIKTSMVIIGNGNFSSKTLRNHKKSYNIPHVQSCKRPLLQKNAGEVLLYLSVVGIALKDDDTLFLEFLRSLCSRTLRLFGGS